MEREWREASDMRPSLVGLGLVLAVAAILRFWSLGSGVPGAVGIDEPEIMTRVVRIMQTGDFNPHAFDHPSLYVYVQLVVACAHFVLGASFGLWGSLSEVTDANFYLWGRIVTAALGTATVYLVFQIGSRWGARHALLAAGLMAVLPNHVRESHFVLTLVPMTFFTTLSFLLTLRALERQTPAAFAWAGAAAGLAAATQYYGGLILVAPLLAAWLVSNPARPPRLLALASIGAASGCFLLAAPYTVLDLPNFLNGVAAATSAVRAQGPQAEPGWFVLAEALKRAFWYSGMLLIVWGLVHAIVRAITGPGKAGFVLLLVFPVTCLGVFLANAGTSARTLTPLLPFLGLLMAIAIVSGVSLLRRFSIRRGLRTALIVALTVVAILPPAVMAVRFDLALNKPSAGQIAVDKKTAEVPAFSKIARPAG